MNVKTLALAAAAAAVATSSQAADLPVAAEPVDYVQACDAFGAGFFKLPGKDTCIKLGGRIRAQVVSGNISDDEGDEYEAYSKGYLYFTSMTNSEIGTIKTYTELTAKWSDDTTDEEIEAGDVYVQLGMDYGSFLFGRESSAFDGFTGYTWIGPVGNAYSDQSTLQASFTADLGNGVTATISAEDATYRGGEDSGADVVGALKISQGWGSFKVAAAAHDQASHEGYGYAAGATLAINLDMLSEGAEFTFQAQYADEAGKYIAADAEETGYALSGGIEVPLSEKLTAALDVSYQDLDNKADESTAAINGSLAYSPVSGLTFAVAAGYADVESDIAKDDKETSQIGARVQYTF
ncbi:Porin omp2a precursor [Pseudovibrio sp. Ad46]|uniref:porin n=1 Tax=unclassified Pseudovibrio TaxID=2627060 RepID=UPI0007AE3EA9|nr:MULTISPECIES: porin [unclassified Pseudovibrio]KZK80154.1 Porin omp2a precursor [Pseudovibrio sp. Ad46]KZK99445.1 Porin omp2a precursor [Pseudovibrio sp. Ad5]